MRLEILNLQLTQQVPFPPMYACLSALPYVEMLQSKGIDVDEFWVKNEGEVNGTLIPVSAVVAELTNDPLLKCWFGLGKIPEEHGLTWAEDGRYFLLPNRV